jgi:hypothetical protein
MPASPRRQELASCVRLRANAESRWRLGACLTYHDDDDDDDDEIDPLFCGIYLAIVVMQSRPSYPKRVCLYCADWRMSVVVT